MDAENVTSATGSGMIRNAMPEAEKAGRSTGRITSTVFGRHGVLSSKSRNGLKANGRTESARFADPMHHTIKTASGGKQPFARNAER